MKTYMARLGAFTFGLDTAAFQELQRSSTYKWEAKNRIGRKPAQQNIGQGADAIRLSGVIYPHYRGGLGQLATLRSQAATGEPFPLIYGFETVGQYCGRFCITGIEETRTVFFDNGAPRKIEFNLTLVEYGEDDAASAVTAAVGAALSVDVPGAVASAKAVAAQAAAAGTEAGALGMLSNAVSSARSVASTVSTTISDINNSDSVRLVRSSISQFRSVQSTVRSIQNAATQLSNAGTDPVQALSALNNMGTSAGSMSDVLTGLSTALESKSGMNNGGSIGTFFNQQIASAAGTTRELVAASDALKSTANSLKALM